MPGGQFRIAVIKGDGIGVDVVEAALEVIAAAERRAGNLSLHYEFLEAGAGYFESSGRDAALGAAKALESADAILLGAIGLPHIRHRDGTEISPHLRWRETLQLYAGVRPVKAYANTPLKLADKRARSIDLVILRESTEGLFYSAAVHNRTLLANNDEVRDVLRISRTTTERLHDFAFELATRRLKARGTGLVTCVDKANVFRSMAFFRQIFLERAANFPAIKHSCNYVDAQAMDLVRRPWEFDVLVMENMFGDILSDLAAGLVGGLGLASSAEIGDHHGLFQAAHGSAPDIMGQDKANPLACILSAALMLDYIAGRGGLSSQSTAARLIENAVESGFESKCLRPLEFGGDQGTIALTKALIETINNIPMPGS